MTLLFNGRNIGIYHTLWLSELLGFLYEAATVPASGAGVETSGDLPALVWEPRGPMGSFLPGTTAVSTQGGGSHSWNPPGPSGNWKQAEERDGRFLQVP